MSGACTSTVLRVGWLRGARWAQARRNRTRSPERLGLAEDARRFRITPLARRSYTRASAPRQESNVRTRLRSACSTPWQDVGVPCDCCVGDALDIFSERSARRELRRYLRRGLGGTDA